MLGVSNRDNRNVDKTINNNNNNKANFLDVKEEVNDEHTRSRERRNICTSLRNLGLNNSLNTESSISSSSCDSSSLFASPTPLINNSSSQSRVEEKRRKEKEEEKRRNSLWFDNRTPPQQVSPLNNDSHHKASSQIKEYVYHRMTGIDYPMRMNYCWDFSSAHAQYVRRVAMAQRAFLSDRVRDFRSTFTRANFELEMDALKKRLDLGQPRPTFADLRRHHSVGY